MSFVRENAGGEKKIEHTLHMPYVPGPDDEAVQDITLLDRGPIASKSIDIYNNDSPHAAAKKTRQWVKARGQISDEGGHAAHVAAVAYLSDHFFIGTISRVHKLWRIPVARDSHKEVKVDEDVRKELRIGDEDESKAATLAVVLPKRTRPRTPKPEVSMMVSLDHTIYFHNPRGFRADEWLFTEMESPWSGDGRGLVLQKIFTQKGELIATCVQEGVVRLKQDGPKI